MLEVGGDHLSSVTSCAAMGSATPPRMRGSPPSTSTLSYPCPTHSVPLALYRPRVVYDLLFRAATDTLATFARDPRHFSAKTGGSLGVTAILHTRGQNLSLHPHLHCVVPEGVLSSDGLRFDTPRHKGFLFPVKTLSKVLRAKFLEALLQAFERAEA